MDNPFNTFLPFNIKQKLLQLFKSKCLLRGLNSTKMYPFAKTKFSWFSNKKILFQLTRVSILNKTIYFEILKHVYKIACLYKTFSIYLSLVVTLRIYHISFSKQTDII